MALVQVPAVIESADALLATARRLIDAETAHLEASPDVDVSCGPGCNACCEHLVVVTAAEHRAIDAAVQNLATETRRAIRERARGIVERFRRDLGCDPTSIERFDPEVSRRYYALAEPCPLLIDGMCSVREVRPLVCRDYLMSSDPTACHDRSLEQTVRIRRRRNVPQRFTAISESFDDARPQLLSVALLEQPAPAGIRRSSGPRLALALGR